MISVLIVDDEAPIRDWVEYCITRESEKFSIIGLASSGEEACRIVEREKPEVIITDISMPGMNGLELMKRVKELSPYTVFIILTNYAEFSYAKEAISHGAREYLLKSEMRAGDLIQILNKIEENKEQIVKSKKEQRFPNGFLDLYELYQAREEIEQEAFLNSMGLLDAVPYQVLCIERRLPDITGEELAALTVSEGLEYLTPAVRNEYLFLIAQDKRERKLEDSVSKIAGKLHGKYGGCVGISQIFVKQKELTGCLKQAVTANMYHFFMEDEWKFEYENLMGLKELNYEKVRGSYQEILMNLSYKQYTEALGNLSGWFSMVKDIRVQDSEWAMERCRRMVLSVEEQCCHLDPSVEEEAKKNLKQESVNKCQEQCEKLIRKLFDKKNGKYSESIEKALNYIHQNYQSDISLVDVAGTIFRSPEYFSRLFKEEVGENFSTYLMLYRLNHAKELLKKTDMKMSEISYAVGYSTQSYFSRLYKKYMGKTPEEERNQERAR